MIECPELREHNIESGKKFLHSFRFATLVSCSTRRRNVFEGQFGLPVVYTQCLSGLRCLLVNDILVLVRPRLKDGWKRFRPHVLAVRVRKNVWLDWASLYLGMSDAQTCLEVEQHHVSRGMRKGSGLTSGPSPGRMLNAQASFAKLKASPCSARGCPPQIRLPKPKAW